MPRKKKVNSDWDGGSEEKLDETGMNLDEEEDELGMVDEEADEDDETLE